MARRFSGFFTSDSAPALITMVQECWPQSATCRIEEPFAGCRFAFPDLDRAAFELLPRFSACFPDTTFVWVDADDSGGRCLYSGFACRAGSVLLWEPEPAADTLGRLGGALGVELDPVGLFD